MANKRNPKMALQAFFLRLWCAAPSTWLNALRQRRGRSHVAR